MISENEIFWKLFEEEKAKGLSDWNAMVAACDTVVFMELKLKSATDAEFEVIPPLMISDGNDDECDATDDDSSNEAG